MWVYSPRTALDGRNFSENFVAGDRIVVAFHAVTTRDPLHLAFPYGAFDYAVGYESSISPKQYDIARKRFGFGVAFDREHITRPDGGQHACAGRAQAQISKGAKDFCRQLASRPIARFQIIGCTGFPHEVLRWKWQDPCVPLTLPQVSALVSNTCSWRTAGFR